MVTPADALFGLSVLVGLVLCLLGAYCYRRWETPGVTSLAACTVLLGLGALSNGVVGFVVGPEVEEFITPLWAQAMLLFWGLATVPWALFALQYTGRYTRVGWRTVGAFYVPLALGVPTLLIIGTLDIGGLATTQFLSTLLLIYCLGIAVLGSFLIVQSVRSYVHLSTGHGVMLAAPPLVFFLGFNVSGVLGQGSELAAIAALVGSALLAAIVLAGVFLSDTVLAWPPAASTIGERTIIEQTDDLVVVLDERDRAIKCNDTAVETLGMAREAILGRPIEAVLGKPIETLDQRETVELETLDGTRRYDAEVVTITDARDRELGFLVSLHDVTEHELREQRLAVLNRVLRHNLRNKVEIVKSHAEILESQPENGHATTIANTADAIAALGHRARTIDQFISHSDAITEVDLVASVERTVSGVDDRDDVTVSLDLPDSATVETNREALCGALESAIDNAVTYAESAVDVTVERRDDEYEIAIADDGPGIPDGELSCLDAGTETALEHGTGLGLWQLKWAVTTMGGDLTFDTTDGTTVTFTVPTQRAVETAQTH